MTVDVLVVVIGLVCGWWAFGRPRRTVGLRDLSPAHPRPLVSVVVPARDEAANIGALLGDLGTSDVHEMIVVDDHSEDATAAVAGAFDGVEVVAAPELPDGWTGKCWACAVGAARATGDVLVFVDADVRFEPGALDRVVAEQDRRGGLVSVQPRHVTERAYERLSALFNVVAVMGSDVGWPRRPQVAFGPVIVTGAAEYEAVGGHGAVRGEVVEDLALAREYRAADLPVEALLGGDDITFRMYPSGARALVEGWTKNFALGAGATRRVRLVGVVGWIIALGTASRLLLGAPWAGSASHALVGALLYAAATAQFVDLLRRVGRFGVVAPLLLPVHLVTFVAIFARSSWLTWFGRSVRWRGREIAVRPTRA